MDDAFAVTRAQQGESKTSMVILRTVTLLKARVSLTVHPLTVASIIFRLRVASIFKNIVTITVGFTGLKKLH